MNNSYIEEILECKVNMFISTSTKSTNSKRKHLKELFNLIFEANIHSINEYGYSEIPRQRFKAIDRYYKELLYWLEDQKLIKIRRSKTNTESYSGKSMFYRRVEDKFISTNEVKNKAFCKGYMVSKELLECAGILTDSFKPNYSFINPYKHISNSLSDSSYTIIRGGASSQKKETTQYREEEKENKYTNREWNLNSCWNQLTLTPDHELTYTTAKKYKEGLNKTYIFNEGRYYGQFHFMKKSHIPYLRLFGEQIQEWGDGTAFFTKLIGKLIEEQDHIPYNEKAKFQQFAINDPYVYLMKKLYLNTRDEAKTLLNSYVNSVNTISSKMSNIDQFFKTNFPHIREWLRSIPTATTIDSETGKRKKKKQLWRLNQYMEAEVMSKLAADLNKKYGVYPLTKHDAIYFNSSDIETLNRHGVNFSVEMKKTLDYKYYNDLIFEI